MLAYVARVYYPPGDRRKSHQQLYISDLDGHHRRQLTHGPKDVDEVQWDGSGALVWWDSTYDNRAATYRYTVYESHLRPFRPRLVCRLESDPGTRASGYRRGVSVLDLDSGTWLIHDGHASPVKDAELGTALNAWRNDDGDRWGFGTGRRIDVKLGQEATTVSQGTRSWTLPILSGGLGFYLPDIDRGDTILLLGYLLGAYHSNEDHFYSLDWATGKTTELVGGLGCMDFDVDSPYYAGTSFAGRGLIPYGRGRNVWGAKLYAGDWKTGKRWLVLGGRVYVTSVAVQP